MSKTQKEPTANPISPKHLVTVPANWSKMTEAEKDSWANSFLDSVGVPKEK